MSNNSVEAVKNAIENYVAKFRRDDFPNLEVSGLYDLFPNDHGDVSVEHKWPDVFPYSGHNGVYLIFDNSLNLRYVGKASMSNTLGSRLGGYFKYSDDGSKGCHIKHSTWVSTPAFLMTVGVPEGMSFEAAALEEYLIKELQPPENRFGR